MVSYRYKAGKEGKKVYQFLLKRRPAQGPLITQVPRAPRRRCCNLQPMHCVMSSP